MANLSYADVLDGYRSMKTAMPGSTTATIRVRNAMTPIPKPEPLKRQKARKAREDTKRAKAFREAVWERDEGRCRVCGSLVSLFAASAAWWLVGHVHHIKLRSLAKREKYDPSNGALVCQSCHAKIHAGTVTLP